MEAPNGVKLLAIQLLLFGANLFGCLRRRRVPVLIYHSLDETGSCISSTKEHFAKQMEFLRSKGYKTLTCSEYVDMAEGRRPFPPRAVVLTFDDGLENNYTTVFPILKKFGLKATIFLATDYIGGQSLWERRQDVPCLPMMTWPMIQEMHAHGIEFQSHSSGHKDLTTLRDDELRADLGNSRAVIEKQLGTTCDILCYPYNRFDERVMAITRQEGFRAAFAGSHQKMDIYCLHRIGSNYLTTPMALATALRGNMDYFLAMRNRLKRLAA